MTTFLALYRGASISSAELVAVSANRQIVSDFAQKLVTEPEPVSEYRRSRMRPVGHHPEKAK
jgi:hypothetical protein